jgi:hypothetical protein
MEKMINKLNCSIHILLVFILLVLNSCATGKNISKPLPSLDATDGNFIVFGYIDPFIHVQSWEKGYVWRRGSHGGLIGAMIRTASPVMVNIIFTNIKTNESKSYSVPEEKDHELFAISLPTGEYELSIDSTTINREFHGPVIDECKIIPKNKTKNKIVYIGDLTVLTLENSHSGWIKHDYKNESIESFIKLYPNINKSTIQIDPKCDTTLTIPAK